MNNSFSDNEITKFQKNVHLVLDDIERFYMLFSQKEKLALHKIRTEYHYPSVLILAEEMTSTKPFNRIIYKIEELDNSIQFLHNLCTKEDAIKRIINNDYNNAELKYSFQEELDKLYAEKVALQEILLGHEYFLNNFMLLYQNKGPHMGMNFNKLKALLRKCKNPKYNLVNKDLINIIYDFVKLDTFLMYDFPDKKLSLKHPHYNLIRELIALLKKINNIDAKKTTTHSFLDKIRAKTHGYQAI